MKLITTLAYYSVTWINMNIDHKILSVDYYIKTMVSSKFIVFQIISIGQYIDTKRVKAWDTLIKL